MQFLFDRTKDEFKEYPQQKNRYTVPTKSKIDKYKKAIIDLKDAGKNIYSLDAICYK